MLEGLYRSMDLIGTAAFAVSGALLARRKELDLFGLAVFAAVASAGGGILRDMALGIHPPHYLREPWYLIIALAATAGVFFFHRTLERIRQAISVFDALGLAFFAVTGTRLGWKQGAEPWAAVLFGLITGIGGGLIRDILAGEIPLVLRKDLYASAALAGSLAYIILKDHLSDDLAAIIAMTACFALRLLAMRRGWSLPRSLQ